MPAVALQRNEHLLHRSCPFEYATVYVIYHDAFSCAAAEITIESDRNRTRNIITKLLLSRNKFFFFFFFFIRFDTIKLEHQISKKDAF